MKDQINPLDMPDDYFRVLLVCTMLDVCGVYFERGATRKKLDFFLTFFQVTGNPNIWTLVLTCQ